MVKLAWSTGKTLKRAGQSFDLAVAAMTVESMGVTTPGHTPWLASEHLAGYFSQVILCEVLALMSA